MEIQSIPVMTPMARVREPAWPPLIAQPSPHGGAGDAGGDGVAAVPGAAEVAAKDVAGGDEGGEGDRAGGHVAIAVPGECRGHPVGGAGGEAVAPIHDEDARGDHADAVDPDQSWRPLASGGAVQGPAQAGRSCDGQDAGDQEVGDLQPAEGAVAQRAQRVAGYVEALAGGGLGKGDDRPQGRRDGRAGEQGAGGD